jgi:very-short-patch-repair endonuclease
MAANGNTPPPRDAAPPTGQRRTRRRGAWHTINALAARQRGLVTRRQLTSAGVSGARIDRELKEGRLHRVHQGVYRVGPVVAAHAAELAAVLACGEAAVLSHFAASALWRMLRRPRDVDRIDVSVTGADRRHPGIRVWRRRALQSADVTRFEGIPITTPTRTLLDIAPLVTARELEQALARALRGELTTEAQLEALLTRNPGRPGAGALRALLGAGTGPAFTRSAAEERFLRLVREAQLAPPQTNARIGGYEVDFLWRTERLIVEIDGWRHHSSRAAFESDRARQSVLAAEHRIMRVTWTQLTREPLVVLARLVGALKPSTPT